MKFLDLDREYEYFNWVKAISPVFHEKCFINGRFVEEFENEVAKFLGAKYAVGVSSGTDALQAALMAIGVSGKTVLTTPYTFIATTEVPIRLGAKVVFCDIDSTFNMNMWLAKQILEDKHVDILLVVHLFGRPCHIPDEVINICKRKGISIIEDSAQAFGSYYELGKYVGTLGKFGCFSFFPAKNLGCAGDGGLVTTNDETYYNALKSIRNHGGSTKYRHSIHGGNFRLDTLQAALLLEKLKCVNDFLFDRRKTAERYIDELINLPLVFPISKPGHSYNQFVIQTENNIDRENLKRYLEKDGIPTMVYYPFSLDEQDCYRGIDFECDCVVSRRTAKTNLALPIAYIKDDEFGQIVRSIRRFYG